MGKRAGRRKPTRKQKQSHGVPDVSGDCRSCDLWSTDWPKFPRNRIPDGEGSCNRPGGHCNPKVVIKPI